MRKKIFFTATVLLTQLLFFPSCQKEATEKHKVISEQATAGKSGRDGNCRVMQYYLYDFIHAHEQIDNYTYKNGLVDEWTTFYGTTYKMAYYHDGRMKMAGAYVDGELLNTIFFVYKNDKVVKEIWYLGNTQEVDDVVVNTYNKKGQIIKNESLNYDYYTLNTYTPQGDLKSWLFFVGGKPAQKGEYTFNKEIKNPLRSARPGIGYSFAWANSAFGAGDRWYSSERMMFYDESGNTSISYDLNPRKTEWTSGEHNYPLLAGYTDILTGGSIINSFKYENCNGKNNDYESKAQRTGISNKIFSERNRRYLAQGSKREIRKKINK
ncbi:MAG: hypothetical protein ABI675_24480 [Chitinophagaceae bacterium]